MHIVNPNRPRSRLGFTERQIYIVDRGAFNPTDAASARARIFVLRTRVMTLDIITYLPTWICARIYKKNTLDAGIIIDDE